MVALASQTQYGELVKWTIVSILTLSVLMYVYNKFIAASELVPVISSFDGKEYLVQDMPDKQLAADTLAQMCRRLNDFMNILSKEYPDDARVTRLNNNFKCHEVIEGDGDYGYTSYTTNKGEEVVLCLRSARDKTLHSQNLLIFVALHEMSHIMSESYGHNKEFKDNFTWLIEEAEARGIYQHQNFNDNPESYCGIMVTATPH
jgi:hypothetical protein